MIPERVTLLALALLAAAQERPTLRAGTLPPDLVLDGVLDEPAWKEAPAADDFTQVDPDEGGAPSERTIVRVLADPSALVVGIRCEDSDPAAIVARVVERDAFQAGEDRVRIVLDTFLDGRTGYLFVVNPLGARYDALVAQRGEGENRNWDGIWEAKAARDDRGWGVEIRIPILTLSFAADRTAWGFNVERRIERRQEIDRWASPSRDFSLTQTSRAGLLTNLPAFALGVGLSVRPTAVASYGRPEPLKHSDFDAEASLDLMQRLAPDLLASLTFNTDFSETEVDERRSNLTRFPLFFPEKRTFFLEGADVFEFGLGLGTDLVPFHSRTLGLVAEREIPLLVGGKVNGRVNGTGVGLLAVRLDEEEGVVDDASVGVFRARQDVLGESTAGVLATGGDPLDRDGAWTAGGDFTFQTSRFLDDKNLLAGVWALATDRRDLDGPGDAAYGAKVDYPNDTLDLSLAWKRIGPEFDPSLGFVPRRAIHKYNLTAEYKIRPGGGPVREITPNVTPQLVTDLDGHWESYSIHAEPLNLEFGSGDDVEVHLLWAGDKPPADFEVSPGDVIPRGTYEWFRYHVQAQSAPKRPVSAEMNWHWGDWYDGELTEYEASVAWNPVALLTISAAGERLIGRIPDGDFRADLYAARVRFNLSPDLNAATFVQYDTESRNLGSFSRLRWTITPLSDLFVVYQYNWQEAEGHLDPQTYEGALKLQYTLRF